MTRWFRQSLLGRLLGIYLLFAGITLGVGLAVNTAVRERVRNEVEASDLALAQAIALETDTKMQNARTSLNALAHLESVRHDDRVLMNQAFQVFKTARRDIDRVYWLDAQGRMQASFPTDIRTLGTDFSEESVFQRAQTSYDSFVEGGAVDLTTFNAVAIIAAPIRDEVGTLRGVLATNLLLDDFSKPLQTIVDQQTRQNQRLLISMLDDQGKLIATQAPERLLQRVVDEIPGASQGLGGTATSILGRGDDHQEWLFTTVPVPNTGWVVVVQRPASDALGVINTISTWLLTVAILFACGGLLFWLLLMRLVIRPLQTLASEHRDLPTLALQAASTTPWLARRNDEVGDLARSLQRLQHDVDTRLSELRTLLEVSNSVVGTLDPQVVIQSIITQVRRLVDVQAVAVLVPDDHDALHVIASVGRSEYHDRSVHVLPDDVLSPSALALRNGQPVAMVAMDDAYFPPLSFAEGFRSLLAIPIISHHVGNVVLSVYRTKPEHFTSNEVDLLLTFANYATLAWEHAVLYERSDERLHEVARENEQLYRNAMQEKQTLTAVMSSMNDGLILADIHGAVLFANPSASTLIGLSHAELEHTTLQTLYTRFADYAAPAPPHATEYPLMVLELERNHQSQAIEVQRFGVDDEDGSPIGHGLLLRDITRQHEVDRFKTTLLAAVGHELRTPLAAIKGHASTLLQHDVQWSNEDQRHFLGIINSESSRLAQLVNHLLDLSRFEAGLLPLQRGDWNISDLIATAVQQLTRSIPQLTVICPASLPLVDVDRVRIEVVLRNILSNAAAYGEGEVLVQAVETTPWVTLSIHDNGPGIDADELPHVFERFYRAQHGLQRRSGGTGLGLAISKAFVQAHGGTIWITSDETGTTFSFTLPCVDRSIQHDTRKSFAMEH